MKSYEFTKPILNESEVRKLLAEDIQSELTTLVNNNVNGPISAIKQKTVPEFAKKLYSWAFASLHDTHKSLDKDDIRGNIDLLIKILDNPKAIALQLFTAMLKKSHQPATAK